MTSTDIVYRIIQSDVCIKKNLARHLINSRALARYIQDAYHNQNVRENTQLSIDAIISAIRRYPFVYPPQTSLLPKHMINKKLIMRNRIVEVAIHNDSEIPPALGRFSSQIDYGRSETFRMVAGLETTRVIVDEQNLGKLLDAIPTKKIKKILKDLAEIIIMLPESTDGVESERVPGVVAVLSSELTMNEISMTECMSCAPDIIIVVEQKDAIRAYELIDRLHPTSS